MKFTAPTATYVPHWMRDIRDKYKDFIANAFILTGNIGDYCSENYPLNQFLTSYLTQSDMDIERVYFYDIEAKGYRVHPEARDKRDEGMIPWEDFIRMIPGSRNSPRSAFVFRYPEYLIPNSSRAYEEENVRIVSLHRVLNSLEFSRSNNVVFIIAESTKDINEKFLKDCKAVQCELPLPDDQARRSYLSFRLNLQVHRNRGEVDRKLQDAIESWSLSMDELVNLTSGLTLVAIEDVLLTAFSRERAKANGTLPPDTQCLTRELIIDRKKQVIQSEYGDVIEILDTAGFSLEQYAGQEGLKNYFYEMIIPSFQNPSITDIAPKGILMMGPPGTGKTYFARCVAGSAGISFLEFKISKILGKYVGESEKSMERALSVFRALAPVGVFIDELDQAFPARSEGVQESSVNSNLFGMLLAEIGKPENRGRILWMAATNYPNRVDEALKRAGRFDKKIPFFAPNDQERRQVLLYHIRRCGMDVDESSPELEELVSNTNGYTQAELESIVVKANELSVRRGSALSDLDALLQSQQYMLSAQNQNVRNMEDLALLECNDAEFIPESHRNRQMELLRPSLAQRDGAGFTGGIRGTEER